MVYTIIFYNVWYNLENQTIIYFASSYIEDNDSKDYDNTTKPQSSRQYGIGTKTDI